MSFTHGAGLDVHTKGVTACRITPDPSGQQADSPMRLQDFGTMTVDLLALSGWLTAAGAQLGGHGEPRRVLATGLQSVGRKRAGRPGEYGPCETGRGAQNRTNRCAVAGQTHVRWLVAGQRDLRALARYHAKLVQERSRNVNRVQPVFKRTNIKLAAVASDIMRAGAGTGIDMAHFGTPSRLAVCVGVAPGNDASAGKRRSGRTQLGNQPLRTVLTQLAHAAALTKGTYLSALYHRLAARRGKKHSMVVRAFPRCSRQEPDQD